MRIGVVGGGSIGLLVSSFIGLSDHHLTLYLRRIDQKEILLEKGIHFQPYNYTVPVNVKLLAEYEDEDLLILCVKQHHLKNVIDQLYRLRVNVPVLFLQNGMSHIQYFKEFEQPTYVGVVEHGSIRKNDWTILHSGKGQIRLAKANDKNEQGVDLNTIRLALSFEDNPVVIEDNWFQMLAEKLVINAVINPITALFRIPNGQVIENHYYCEIAKKACREASNILQLSDQTQWKAVVRVVRKTASNRSSMLKDIEANRSTEIDSILGFLRQRSTGSAPTIEFLYNSIKGIEAKFQGGE